MVQSLVLIERIWDRIVLHNTCLFYPWINAERWTLSATKTLNVRFFPLT